MSRLGMAAWVLAGFCLAVVGFFKFVLNTWHASLLYVLMAAGIFLLLSIIKDRALYWEFLTLRTTKHGMNMGALILLVISLLVSLNYITHRHNKSFDMTLEGLNSLSDQSIKVLGSLKGEVEIKLFYDSRDREASRDKIMFRDVVALYQDQKRDIKYEAINAVNNPGLAKEYDVKSPRATAFVVYQGKKRRLNSLDEQGLTNALINASREKNKVIYFTKGHGEWPLDPDTQRNLDISEFKQALIDSSYEVKPLDLMLAPKVPDDATVVAIIGPKNIFLENELKALEDYAKAGGSLFLALDPGVKHNLAEFLKKFGVEFTNKYVLDAIGQQFLNSAAISIGTEYSSLSAVTKNLSGNERILFNLASPLKRMAEAPSGIIFDEIIKTSSASLAVQDLPKAGAGVQMTKENQGPHVVAFEVKGKLTEKGKTAPSDQKEFSMLVFGDSDFVIGGLFRQDPNRNLALNAMAWLSKDTELISIRPKAPKGVSLILPRMTFVTLILTYLGLSIGLFGIGTFFWFRRRTA